MKDNFERKALIIKAVDGDTIDCQINQGFGDTTPKRLRLIICNCPEAGKAGYQEAKDFTSQFVGKEVYIKTYKDTSDAGWGRYLAYVEVEYEGQKISLHELLLSKGLATYYAK